MEVGIVGKPNVGKSTFFMAATLAKAEIANYPFTTIEANKGVAYVRSKCPHMDFGVQCTPNNSLCEDGVRQIPVELIDVAGLVPDAHTGKGLGNRFLDDLRQANALIHIVDLSGSTDIEGTPVPLGSHDPGKDVDFLDREIAHWFMSIIMKDWYKIARQSDMGQLKVEEALSDKFTGLGITPPQVYAAIREADLGGKVAQWGDDGLLKLCGLLQKHGKPIIIAANKADLAGVEALAHLSEVSDKTIISASAELELALRRASKAGLIEYVPGSNDFNISSPDKLSSAQNDGLEQIREFLQTNGSTGVQTCLEKAVYDVLDLIVVYPVEDETHLTDKEGRILPDAHLIPKGSTARDLAFKVHTDLGNGFIRGIDCRTKRIIGSVHELKDGDVIKIVAKT